MKPEQSARFENKESNIIRTEYGSILCSEGIYYAVSHDGEMSVPVPDDIAVHISTVMKIQEKAYSDFDEGAGHVLQTFNCRKSALVVSGAIPIEASIVDMSNSSGETEMFADVERLLRSKGEVVALEDYAAFEEVLNDYDGGFPCIVHLFESSESIDVSKFVQRMPTLHRVHSFIVLGEEEGGYVCFQKSGPQITEPFTISDLSLIMHFCRNQSKRIGYFVHGPYK